MRRRTPAVWMRRLLPRELRQEYGDDFVALLQERVDEEKANRGRVAALRYWVRGFVDVSRTALRGEVGAGTPAPVTPGPDRSRVSVVFDAVAQDLRFGARQLRCNPGFTAVAVLTLAIGIGVNAAVYNVINARLRPPPVRDPGSVVSLYHSTDRFPSLPFFSYPDYLDLRDRNDVFSGLAAFRANSIGVGGSGYPEQVTAAQTSDNYFEVLGVAPTLGRALGPSDSEPDAEPAAVISHELWHRRFGGDPHVIGADLVMNGARPFTIVGVAPERYWGRGFGEKIDVWYPATMRKHVRHAPVDPASNILVHRQNRQFLLIGRLKPGVTLERAQAAMSSIAEGLARAYPETNDGYDVVVTPGTGLLSVAPRMRARFMRMSTFALVAAGIVLLIVCVNISGMLLARSLDRSREIAIRRSVGASRGRLFGQLISECVLLASAAGSVGLLLARWTSQLLSTVLPRQLQADIDLGVDLRVAAFTAAVSVLAVVLFGLAPAWRLSGTRSTPAQSGAKRGVPTAQAVRKLLLAAQVAASLLLLIGAGLFARSLRSLNDVDPGFDPDNVLTAFLWAGPLGYSAEAEVDVLRMLRERAAGSPGVGDAGIGSLPIIVGEGEALRVWPATREPVEADAAERVSFTVASVGYHRTLEIPLALGRSFSARDAATEAEVVVVNEAMAQRLWPGVDPLGQEITLFPRPPWLTEPRRVRVIGVSRDTAVVSPQRWGGAIQLEEDPGIRHGVPNVDLPLWISTPPSAWASLLVRTTAPPASLIPILRDELLEIDPNLVLFAEPLADRWARLTVNERTYVTFTGLFGLLAASLCAVGIYGAMAHAVSRRTHEIGVRRALGAPRSSLVRAVVLQGAVPALVGVAIGIGVALALSRIIASLLYGVTATDPLTYCAVGALVLAVALLAAWVPARRAARVDPVEPLRAQ